MAAGDHATGMPMLAKSVKDMPTGGVLYEPKGEQLQVV
jgi:hypothetical protein